MSDNVIHLCRQYIAFDTSEEPQGKWSDLIGSEKRLRKIGRRLYCDKMEVRRELKNLMRSNESLRGQTECLPIEKTMRSEGSRKLDDLTAERSRTCVYIPGGTLGCT